MISLILPYWNRQEATDRALRLLGNYNLDLEVILVDDGSPKPFRNGFDFVRVIRLPTKFGPLNPCVPYNAGVSESRGEYIALSNPETLHAEPVLRQMQEEVDRNGDSSYVMCGVWCPEQKRWHCHSSRERSEENDVGHYLPQGSDYHFMTMMKRSLWDKTGGFDEDYRDGAGYDDPDFVRRLHRAGARFIRRDDLVVHHVREGAHADWRPEMFLRNRAVFLSKWLPLKTKALA